MSQFAVKPGSKIKLSRVATSIEGDYSKEEALKHIEDLANEFASLEDTFFFAAQRPILIVLQGMDTAGKDGAIRHILEMSNIISTRVACFKRPTEEELGHDYLWRVHKQTPRKGEIVIFNRSHYEDVLVVKVHELAKPDVIEKRYDHINQFEKMLTDTGTIILKFFLHISKEEQEERLLEREQDPNAAWKLAAGDWQEREYWDAYQEAYETAIERCSTDYAPWHIIPSDKKTQRNLAITQILVDTFKEHDGEWKNALEAVGVKAKAGLEEYRAAKNAKA